MVTSGKVTIEDEVCGLNTAIPIYLDVFKRSVLSVFSGWLTPWGSTLLETGSSFSIAG